MANLRSVEKKTELEKPLGIHSPSSESPRQIIIDILATAMVDILLVEKSVDWRVHGPSTS